MSAKNLEVVTYALWRIGVVDETQAPTATQGITALTVLNDYLATLNVDGIRVGWYPQTDLAATAPLRDSDIYDVKILLCRALASEYGIKIEDTLLLDDIIRADERLTKRSLRYFESDLSELSRPQGGPYGGPNWQ